MSLNATPSSNRIHIALFGKRNSGKSTLINALTGQNTALTSDIPGTTTDPVAKAMEIHPLGPCVLIDTAGFDDEGALGALRVDKTRKVIAKTDIAILVFADAEIAPELAWAQELKERKIPCLPLLNKCDVHANSDGLAAAIEEALGEPPLRVSALGGQGVDEVKRALTRLLPEGYDARSITRHLVEPGDVVLLVMPQDIQAPKGRLILPQVQTIRDLLDNQCVVISATYDKLGQALDALKVPPKLIITDSQVFPGVYAQKPPESALTSFSVLFARYKGDIDAFVQGAAAIDALTESDRVLIAEACTHSPLDGDIGRIKLPELLRRKVGPGLAIDLASGVDFDGDLNGYSLIIHCGACMFNRKYVLSRIEQAQAAGVPITNYGVAIAKLTGILENIQF